MITIENEYLKVGAEKVAGEFVSMIDKKCGAEFVYQGDDNVWRNKAKNLFPVCGKSKDDIIVVDGVEYPMPMHGLAKTTEFELFEKTDTKMSFLMKSNEETRAHYPYEFRFFIEYELDGDTLSQRYRVENVGDKTMYFCVGGHTGFNFPIEGNVSDYYIKVKGDLIEEVADGGLITGETRPYPTSCGVLTLSDSTFDEGSHSLSGFAESKLEICSDKYGYYMTVEFEGFPHVVLWSQPKKVDYVAIEPWVGLNDRVDSDHDLKKRKGVVALDGGKVFEVTQKFTCGKR